MARFNRFNAGLLGDSFAGYACYGVGCQAGAFWYADRYRLRGFKCAGERDCRFFQKKAAGAEFAVTQPVFDVESLLNFMEKVRETEIPIIAGIWPLVSVRNAEFMKHEVPGVFVPDDILERMKQHEDKHDQVQEGIRIAREILTIIKDKVQGVQIAAPFGNVQYALDVTSGII